MTKPRLARRQFLRGLAGAALALPLLEACEQSTSSSPRARAAARGAQALAGDRAKRFVAFGVWNGVIPGDWFPSEVGSNFTLPTMLEPLARHQARILIPKGVDNKVAIEAPNRNGHAEGVASLLSGRAPLRRPGTELDFIGQGVTIDQVIADHLSAQSPAAVRSLQVGVRFTGGTYGTMAYAGVDQPLDPTSDPNSLFRSLFGDPNAAGDAIERARARRASVLDGTLRDYERIRDRVSGEDRRRIEAHLEAVREVERQISTPVTGCDPANMVLPPTGTVDLNWHAFMEIVALAFSCDITRVASFSFDHAGGGGAPFPWVGVEEDVHELSHQIVGASSGSSSVQKFRTIRRWFSTELATFVDRLSQMQTPTGESLMDGTVIFQGSDLAIDHNQPDMPFLIMAGQRTPFSTGRVVQCSPKVPHNHLLVTLARSFGVPIDSFGDPAHANGNLDAQLLLA